MDNGNNHELRNAIKMASVMKYGVSGPIAAADLVWQQKKNIGMLLGSTAFLLILPVLFLCMLPSFIFGSFSMTNAWNDNAVMMQNIQRYQTAVWSAIDEAHDDLLQELQSKDEDGKEIVIIDDFNFSSVNTTLILCQYCVAKGTEEITVEELETVITAHSDVLFSYTKSGSDTYQIRYVGDAYFADHIFKLTEEQKELAEMYASNLELFLYGSNFGSVSAQVSESVLQYGALVEKYAQKYGISHFVDVINAVMMAESGGRVPDVMQASECPYNKKYPNEPNGITDPEYSIEVGVH